MMKKLSVLGFLLSAFAVSAATVTFPLVDLTGTAAARKLTISPKYSVSKVGTSIAAGGSIVIPATNASPSVVLVTGQYTVAFDGLPMTMSLNIPSGSGSYSATDAALSPSLTVYTYTNGAVASGWPTNWPASSITNAPWLTNFTASSGMFWATGGLAVGASPNQPHLTSSGAGGSTLLLTPSPVAAPDSVLAVQPNITLASGVSFSSVDAANANNLPLEFRASEFLLNDVVNGGRLRTVANGDSGLGMFAEGSLSGDPVPLTLRASEIRLVPGGGEATGTNVFVEGDLGLDSLFASNSITLGGAYSTVLTSSSAGLSIDQPVTATSFNGSGSGLTGIPGASITGSLTNNTSGNSAYATNSGTAAYVSGNLTNRVSFSTNAALASFVSGKLTNSISGTADEALFANSAGTATSATSANTASFATSATSATYAQFATNAYSFFTSNLLQIGSSYPTILTSSSAGLSIDQPVTAPSYTVGSGGPSISASGKTLTVGTNVSIGTNFASFSYGSQNTLMITNGAASTTGTFTPAAIDASGNVTVRSGTLYANTLAAVSSAGQVIVQAGRPDFIGSGLLVTSAAGTSNQHHRLHISAHGMVSIGSSNANAFLAVRQVANTFLPGGNLPNVFSVQNSASNALFTIGADGHANIANTLTASNIVTTNITLYGTTATPPLLFSTNNALLSAVTPGAVEYGASNRALYFTTWLVRRSVPLAQNLIWSNAVENKPLIVTNTTAETPVYTFAMATNFIPRAGGKAWHVKLAGRHWSGNNQGFTLRTYIGSTDATNLLFTLDSPIAGTKSALQWKYDSMITAVSGDGTNNTFYANGDLLVGTASTQAGADDLVRNTLTQTNAMIVTISNSTTTATGTFLRQGWTTVIDQVPGQ